MEYSKYAKLFFFCDLLFCILFAIIFWLEHQHVFILGIILLFAVVTLYPLYKYTQQWSENTKVIDMMWHVDYQYNAILYALSRLVFLLVFIFVSIIDKAQIDVIHIAMHLSVITNIAILVMMTLVFIALYCARKLYCQHYIATRKNIVSKTSIFSDVSSLKLIPDNSATHDADSISQMYNNEKTKQDNKTSAILNESLLLN
jgi:uncharacterized Tic20 family protein